MSERPFIPGVNLMIVNNYKQITIPNNSLNPTNPIVVAQAKPQPQDQMQVAVPFRLAHTCRPKMHMPYVKHCKSQQHTHMPYMRHYKKSEQLPSGQHNHHTQHQIRPWLVGQLFVARMAVVQLLLASTNLN